MSKPAVQKIVPHLWYVREAEEAARFYATVFPDSRVDRVTTMPAESPAGPPGSVVVVEFTLCGQAFMSISAGRITSSTMRSRFSSIATRKPSSTATGMRC
jgi:predicted 3-demethylubiquinone-9 3-methyltransferase (glyoxalase superfamily)